MQASLRLALGDTADIEMERALEATDCDRSDTRPGSLRKIRDSINASLNLRYGVLAASRNYAAGYAD